MCGPLTVARPATAPPGVVAPRSGAEGRGAKTNARAWCLYVLPTTFFRLGRAPLLFIFALSYSHGMRDCLHCGLRLERKSYETPRLFEQRKFCGHPCRAAYHGARRRGRPSSLRGRPSPLRGRRFSVRPVVERFLSRVEFAEDGCWIWVGTIDAAGYGAFSVREQRFRAHRWAYEHFRGEPPGDYLVCHTCDVPSCVNPDHLFLGTPADNSADMVAKGRQQRGERHSRAKLSDADVVAIRDGSETNAAMARRYGVSECAISLIRRGLSRRHFLPPQA